MSFFNGLGFAREQVGGTSDTWTTAPAPPSVAHGTSQFYSYQPIRTEKDLTDEEKPKVEIVDPMGMSMSEVLALLRAMRPKNASPDDIRRVLRDVLPPKREVVADPYMNLKIALNSLPRREKRVAEDEIRRIVKDYLDSRRRNA